MSVFEYVAGMITVVLGLGVAHLLGSLGSLAASQGRIRAHWVQILWIVLLLGLHLQAWVSLWSLRGLSEWRIGQMVGALVAAGLIVIVSRILVPHVDVDTEVDLRERYFQVRVRFFAALSALWILRLFIGIAVFGGDPWAPEGLFQTAWLVLSVVGALVARPAWHAIIAVIWALLLVGFLLVARGPLSA